MNTGLNNTFLWVAGLALSASCALKDPFPMGFSMGAMGTILYGNTAVCRQPWIPACFTTDTLRWSVACACTDFYNQTNIFKSEGLQQYVVGGTLTVPRFMCKASFFYFNAFSLYFERMLFLSIGTPLYPHIHASAELEWIQPGLLHTRVKTHSVAVGGFSCCFLMNRIAISGSFERCWHMYQDIGGISPPFSLRAGIHTRQNRMGSLGVIVSKEPYTGVPAQIIIGEDIVLSSLFTLYAACSIRPFMIGTGVVVEKSGESFGFGVVHHQMLGLSRGVAFEMSR